MAPSIIQTVSPSESTEGVSKLTTSACCPTEVDGASSTVEEMKKVKNPSLQVTADHRIKMVEAPILRPGKGEVLLHVKVTGICGYGSTALHFPTRVPVALTAYSSDIHFWKSGKIGTLIVDGDCILGHEAAGVVIEVGEGVEDLQQGDRVAMEPGVPCGNCFLCANGRYNLCEDVKFAGVYPNHGSLQRYKVHPARWVHKSVRTFSECYDTRILTIRRLPDNVTFAQGALLEPLSVVMHGISRTRLALGRGALICGAGPIGLIALTAARASGAHPIVITDLEPSRLAFAREFEPLCQTYQIDRNLSAQGNAKAIRRLFGETEYKAPDTILECTGVESSVVTAAYTVRRGGDLMVIGLGRDILNNLPFMHISLAEVRSQPMVPLHTNRALLDQSKVYQQIRRYLASGDQRSIRRRSQSRQVGHAYFPT